MNKEVQAIALCRVSSLEQLQNNSLRHQKDNVLKAAEMLGATIPSDGIWEGQQSSKKGVNFNRRDLQQMVEYCKRNKRVKYLIVQEVDRFMRSPDEQIYWQVKLWHELNVKVWYADKPELNEDTHVASLLRYMEGWRAGGSNEERINKSINGQTAALREGRYPFVPKPGYMRGTERGVPMPHPQRGPALQRVLKRLSAGKTTPTSALKELNESEFSQQHSVYKMDKFAKIAMDPFYAGVVEVHKQVDVRNENGLHEPLITMEEHERLVAIILNKPKYQSGPNKNGNPSYPLSNSVSHEKCAELRSHGRLVGLDLNNGKNKAKVYGKYRCRTCKKYWDSKDIHEQMTKLLAQFVLTDNARRAIVNALDDVWKQNEIQVQQEITRLKQSIKNLKTEMTKQVEAAIDPSNEALKDDILAIIDRKKDETSKLQDKLWKLSAAKDQDRKEFINFALSLISDTSKHYLQGYVTKANRLRCKQLVFPADVFINEHGKVYTPEISIFYRLAAKKKSAEALDNSHLVRVKRL